MTMSEEKRGEEDEEGGPGLVFMPFVVMDDLLDKLRLLKYEADFTRRLNLKPISRHYFAIPTNPGEQFYIFTSLAAWLLRCAGRSFEQPQEYDDPNATISSILEEVRQFSHAVDFPPSKLKQGYGEHCIYVIDRLADEALRAANFSWGRPTYPETNEENINIVEDDSELTLYMIRTISCLTDRLIDWPSYPEEEADEENIVEDDSELTLNDQEDILHKGPQEIEGDDGDDEPMLDLEGLRHINQSALPATSRPDDVLESKTDAADWRLEVERVLPQLRVTIRTDNKDWRVHTEQMHQHKSAIDNSLSETKTFLDKLHDDLSKTLEKITSREKYINNQLDPSLQEFRALQDQLAECRERYRQASGGVTERSRLLADVTEELERVKMDMEERGSSMTDGAPLVKIKQSIQQLRKDNTHMDIRIGVLEHMLLQAKLKDKTHQNKQVHGNYDYAHQI